MASFRPRALLWLAGAAAASALALAAPPAEASSFFSTAGGITLVVAGGVLITFGVADTVFFVNDIVEVADGRRPDSGWALAETLVAAPQAISFHIALFFMASDRTDDSMGALFVGVPFASLTTMLTVHGLWVSTGDPAPADAILGVSAMTGAAAAWTVPALGRGVRGGLFARPLGAAEMAFTSPGLALSVYKGITEEDHRPLWITLAAWNGVLWAHGLASLIADDDGEPGRNRPRDGEARPPARSSRPFAGWGPVRYPGGSLSWTVGPAPIPAASGPAGGVMVMGVF